MYRWQRKKMAYNIDSWPSNEKRKKRRKKNWFTDFVKKCCTKLTATGKVGLQHDADVTSCANEIFSRPGKGRDIHSNILDSCSQCSTKFLASISWRVCDILNIFDWVYLVGKDSAYHSKIRLAQKLWKLANALAYLCRKFLLYCVTARKKTVSTTLIPATLTRMTLSIMTLSFVLSIAIKPVVLSVVWLNVVAPIKLVMIVSQDANYVWARRPSAVADDCRRQCVNDRSWSSLGDGDVLASFGRHGTGLEIRLG